MPCFQGLYPNIHDLSALGVAQKIQVMSSLQDDK